MLGLVALAALASVAGCRESDPPIPTARIKEVSATSRPATTTPQPEPTQPEPLASATSPEPTPAPIATRARDPACPVFHAGRTLGTLDNPALVEISGVAASRTRPGVLYVHNDSGDAARFFALNPRMEMFAEYQLEGITAIDWEDVAIGPASDGVTSLFFADTGDNSARETGVGRDHVEVVRVPEPTLSPGKHSLSDAVPLPLVYPDRPHDCEALAVDPTTGDLYLATKEADTSSLLFTVHDPKPGKLNTLTLVGEVGRAPNPMPLGFEFVTAMDFHFRADAAIVRTYESAWLWQRDPNETWGTALARTPRRVPTRLEALGEGITFADDRQSYVTISEGERSPVWLYSELSDCRPTNGE